MSRRRWRVVVAPDKFKGSLSAGEVAAALARGLRRAPDVLVVEHPIADGGEGTVEMMLAHEFRPRDVVVRGPLDASVTATIALSESGDTAVVEMAAASGLALLGRDPDIDSACTASSYGLGQLLSVALDHGAARVIVGLGGSATMDGGAGALVALGARIRDADGEYVLPGGRGLADAQELDLTGVDPRLRSVEIVLASDVDNPLTGPTGAAAVYGPQKGATASAVVALDDALAGWADLVAEALPHRWLDKVAGSPSDVVADIPSGSTVGLCRPGSASDISVGDQPCRAARP